LLEGYSHTTCRTSPVSVV